MEDRRGIQTRLVAGVAALLLLLVAGGVVYRAVDAFKGRQVAIKQLHAHLLRQPEQAERYRKLLRNEVMLTAGDRKLSGTVKGKQLALR